MPVTHISSFQPGAHTRAWRLRLLATVCGLALPIAAVTPAFADKIDGQFSGGAQSVGVSGISPDLGLSLHNSAAAGCPCRGTKGVVEQKSTASINAPGIMSLQATLATSYGDKTRKMAVTSQSSTITGLNLLGGLITADALEAVATVNATDSALTKSDAGTTITNLVVAGTPIDPNVADNTSISLPGFGSVTIKKVSGGKNSQQVHESVEMLEVDISTKNSLGLPIGAKLVIGRAKAGYDRMQPESLLNGGGSGLKANAEAGSELDEAAGSAAAVGMPGCSGTNGKTLTKSVTNLSVPGLLSIGTITNTALGSEGKTSLASTSSTASNVSLLGGLLTVKSVAAYAQESSSGGVDTPSTAGSGFLGLAIAGLPVDPSLPPNTSLALPGIGSVTINEQILGAKSSVQVNGLHIKVTEQNLLGLAVGADIVVAHASASAKRF